MTREYPLTGVGAGSYRVLAPDYWRAMANDSLPLDNAQNWWRHQIAELGVFGGALSSAFSVLVGWRVSLAASVEHDVGRHRRFADCCSASAPLRSSGCRRRIRWCCCGSSFSWRGSCALVPDNPPRDGDRVRRSCGWLGRRQRAGHRVRGRAPAARRRLAHVAERAQRAHRDYVSGAYPPEPLPKPTSSAGPARMRGSSGPRGRAGMAVRFWAHHPDIATRPVHVTLTSPCGVLFDEDLTPATLDQPGHGAARGAAHPGGHPARLKNVEAVRPGGDDDRDLGVGIVADFSSDPAFLAKAQNRTRRAVRLRGWYIIFFSTRPEGADSEGRDSPEVSGGRGSLRVRQHVQDALDQARTAPRNLLRLPSVLHRPPEADRHRRPRRAVHQEVRLADIGAAQDGGESCEGRQDHQDASRRRQEARRRRSPPDGHEPPSDEQSTVL